MRYRPINEILEAFTLLGSTCFRRSHQRWGHVDRGAHKSILASAWHRGHRAADRASFGRGGRALVIRDAEHARQHRVLFQALSLRGWIIESLPVRPTGCCEITQMTEADTTCGMED